MTEQTDNWRFSERGLALTDSAIRELSKSFTFGDQIRVRNNGLGSEPSAFVFGTKAEHSKLEGDGEITAHSTRYGVRTALQQHFGMCWDYSDCFVTLCRAAGLPSRQVYGWLHPVEGHIWAEVLIDGEGWRQVDPQAGGGCDSRYVPFMVSESGAMPVVYTSAVRIVPRLTRD